MNKYLRRAFKVILWIVASIVFIVLLLAFCLTIPAVQNKVKNKVVTYLKHKTKTEISLESIRIALPKDIVLNKFYIEDLKGDTLLFAEKLQADISLFKLLKNTVEINNIELKNIRANIKRVKPDTVFNFSFLVDAFLSEEKKQPTETSSPLKFRIDKVLFQDIGLLYRDDVAGNDVRLHLGEFRSKVKDFDMAKQHYVIKELSLKNSSLNYLQQKPLISLVQHLSSSVDQAKTTQGKLPLIEIEQLNLSKVRLHYDDRLSKTDALIDLNEFGLTRLSADLTNAKYLADKALLNHSAILFAYSPAPSNQLNSVKDTAQATKLPFTLGIKSITLAGNRIKFDNLKSKPAKGVDFNHLDLTGLNFNAEQLAYSASGIKIKVNEAMLNDKSGFIVNKLAGDVNYTSQQIKVLNFKLRTPNTRIENTTELNFNNIDDLTAHPEKVALSLTFKNTTLGLKDAFFFSQAIPANYRSERIKLNAIINGRLNNLSISKLQLDGFKNTQIDITGKAKGLPDLNKTYLDLNIRKLNLTKGDLLVFIPEQSLPAQVSLPQVLRANGHFKGSLTQFKTDFSVKTDLGDVILTASMQGPKDKESYTAKVRLNRFNVGKLLKQQPVLGHITMNANVSGTGLDVKKMKAKFSADIAQANYNQYNYHNLSLSGDYNRQILNLKSNMPDSNASFDLSARINLSGKYPAVNGNIDIKQVDLQKLNFSKTPFKIAGNMKAEVTTADIDYLNGSVFATGIQVVKDGRKFNIDTVKLTALSTATSNQLVLRSPLLRADLNGKYQLSKIGDALVNQLNRYYQFGEVKPVSPQRFKFAIRFDNPKLLKNFIPELSTFAPANINGLIDTQKDSLLLNAYFPKIVYGDYQVDNSRLNLSNKDGKLGYKLLVNSIQSPDIALFATEISGTAANNELSLNVFLRDRERKDKYKIGGIFKSIGKDFRFSIDPARLTLAYEKWTIDPTNFIQFGQSGILANQFNLNKGNEMLRINSTSDTLNSPVQVAFKDFHIATLTHFAETDSTLVGGTIDGTVTIKDLAKNLKFEADLGINQLRYQKDDIGNVSLKVNNYSQNAFQVDASLKGVHELNVSGYYYTAPQSALDLRVNIDKIDLKEVESISLGQIKQGKGTLSGKLTVKGGLTTPKILGNLSFNNAGFNIAYVNSYFTMPTQQINFTGEGIQFDNFTIVDSLNKKATIDGIIYTSDFSNARFALDVKTNNFRVLHSTAEDNDMFYGTVYLTSTIKVRGNINQPDLNMDIRINKGTKFYYSLPVNDPAVIDQEGIVQFIDADAPPLNGNLALKTDSLNKSTLKSLNLVARIKVDPEATLTVVVDPANGDALSVKGDADLNATMDPSGKISLTGRYEINDGSYNLSVGPLGKKEFKIVKGSTITWTGEPTSATVNLTALYEVNAAPIDLINEPDNVQAKTKLPFQVYLIMKEELLKPKISFRLDLPENERGALDGVVYTKLQNVNRNESELNKQVFALLALNRFIASNPFQSLAGGGGGVSTLARSSVSKLLTEQLNNLASDLIQGVDINFDLNSSEDYSTGALEQKTDLEVGLSKKLLNDRLTVSVGSSFGLEGPQSQRKNATNIAGNVNIEYALSADGRYRLRAYRRNQNEGVIEGQIIETGLGFTLVVDYNKFREIFQKKSRRKNRNTERRARRETIN